MFCLIPMIAWLATLWAMHGYSLTGKKMKEIQAVNNARKQGIAEGMTLEQAMEKWPGEA
jgi:Na+/melibiose symporter-like transporter